MAENSQVLFRCVVQNTGETYAVGLTGRYPQAPYVVKITQQDIEMLYKLIKREVAARKINPNNLAQIQRAISQCTATSTNLNTITELCRRGTYWDYDFGSGRHMVTTRSFDVLKATAQTIQRMILKKEDAPTAAKSAVAAMGALQAARFLATIPAADAVAIIGGGSVIGGLVVTGAILTGEFLAVYAGTRFILQNTKTGEKIDMAMTNAMKGLFNKKVQDVLVKKSPEEIAKMEKKMKKLIADMDAPITKSLIYGANPPHKPSRKK